MRQQVSGIFVLERLCTRMHSTFVVYGPSLYSRMPMSTSVFQHVNKNIIILESQSLEFPWA